MMDRVGTLGYANTLLSAYQNLQSRNLTTQQQISTGKVGDQYMDVKDKASVLAAAKAKAAAVEDQTATVKEVSSRLSLQDVQLQELDDIAGSLREALTTALGSGHGDGIMAEVESLYQRAVTVLNFKVDGKYIYGGSRTDVPPVNAPTLADLQAAPDVASVFDNSTLKQTQKLDDNETIETGIAASEVGTNLFQMFKDIADFNAGANGPFATNLTNAQTQFVTTQQAAVPGVLAEIDSVASVNGIKYKQAQSALDRHEATSAYFAKFISDIEDVDLAEAVSRLNMDQAAAQAAARMIAGLNQLSLLNFLPVA